MRWNDGLLDAEVDMPGAREKTNIMPHLKGRFTTLPDGTVQRLEYTVYIPSHEQEGSVNYSIDYRFDGKWGAGFPSYVAVYLSGETNHNASVEEQELFYESEIEEWDINQTPSEEKMNPDLNFQKSEQYVISNNIAYFLEKNFTGDKGKFQRIESSADLSAKSAKQTQVKNTIRYIILAAIVLPLVIWGWLAAKQNKQTNNTNRS